MDGRIGKDATAATLVTATLEGTLTDGQAEQLAALDPALQKLAWLAAAQRIAEQDARICEQGTCIAELKGKLNGPQVDPATPSGQRPIYTKPPAPKRKGKPGARKGHEPARRAKPQRIDHYEEHRLDVCPDCGGELQRCSRTSKTSWKTSRRSSPNTRCIATIVRPARSTSNRSSPTHRLEIWRQKPQRRQHRPTHRTTSATLARQTVG